MKSRAYLALAVGGGYLLGRTKKLKLAMTVAGLAAGRRLVGPGGLVTRGVETLRSAPEFEDMRGQVQERLVSAGRMAALTTASNAVGRITARVNGPSPGRSKSDEDESDEDADNDDDGARDEAENDEDRSEADDVYDEPEDTADEGDDEDDQADEDRPQKRGGSRKASPRKRTSKQSSARKSTSSRSKASADARSGGDRG